MDVMRQYGSTANLESRTGLHERFTSAGTIPWLRWAFDQLQCPPSAQILDVGCGLGRLWSNNAERVPAMWTLTLADRSPAMVEQARRGAARLPCRTTGAITDIVALPWADGSFDVVIANHMLYHVPDRQRAIMECARVLRHGGVFYASTNGAEHLRELRQLVSLVCAGADAWSAQAVTFSAENGGAQLARWFSAVEMREKSAVLEVTDPDAIVRYVQSTERWSSLPADALRAIRDSVTEEVATRGSFRVTSRAVLFVCSGPWRAHD